ncbi:cyclin-T2 isoform X2 [Coccinella septempunctata]|uniref:cyclin-T2 isoform X2 n=1 Tax=Coccinella septempunctata TaxID=41139 RepID=UPI001D074776|nr:cyclin-T2 isoform X2 [Coccinella septempunctata]
MATRDKWYFTKEELENTPSRRCGYDAQKELSYRQQAANFIQDMGQRLKVTQLCINTAIVYMHRFYVFHSFSNFLWHHMAAAALFLAAKVEEQPRKLEYVIRIANACRNSKDTVLDVTSEKYLAQSQDLVFNENVLLQTLGFDVAIDHPHTHVVRCCQLVRASKDLAQTSYFMASNSLHLTTMCLQYKPTVVACFCIHLASKWSSWEIPLSSEQKEWFSYVDTTVTADLLQQLTEEFLVIFESSPSRLKEKIIASENQSSTPENHANFTMEDLKKGEAKDPHGHRSHDTKNDDPHKSRSSRPHDPNSLREKEYRERKERERLAAQQHGSKISSSSSQKLPPHGHHHRHPIDPNKCKPTSQSQSRPPSSNAASVPTSSRSESRDGHREGARDSSYGLTHSRDSHHGKELVRDPQQVRGEKEKRDYLLKHNANDTNNLSNKYLAGYVPEKHRSSSSFNVDSHVTDKHRSSSVDSAASDKHRSSSAHVDPNVPEKHRSSSSHGDLNVSNKHRSSSHGDPNVTDRHRSSSVDPNRSAHSVDPNKVPSNKHDQVRKSREEVKPVSKNDPDNMKKHLNSSAYYAKSTHSTSQKVNSDPNKSSSVLKQSMSSSSHMKPEHKPHHHNGNNSNSFDPIYPNSNLTIETDKVKQEIKMEMNEKIPTPQVLKRPSLFSPTDTPPKENSTSLKTNSTISIDDSQSPSTAPISFMPLGESSMGSIQRNAEPELRPVMKKIDEIEGYENILTSSSIGVVGSKHLDTPGLLSPIIDRPLPPAIKEEKHTPTTTLANGIETNPEVISSLLKETPSIPKLSQPLEALSKDTSIQNVDQDKKEKEHHHKSKKKNKEKHKHKDKDKDKDKEKKKKHKEKDREKHKHKEKQNEKSDTPMNDSNGPPEPKVVLKLPKSKIQNTLAAPEASATSPPSLKIRIPKDVIKTENTGELPQPVVQPNAVGGFKIKIPKDIINNCSSSSGGDSSSRKRERERNSTEGPPAKVSKSGVKEKQNGRHSYNKVHLGDSDLLQNRLAESKYTKTSSS